MSNETPERIQLPTLKLIVEKDMLTAYNGLYHVETKSLTDSAVSYLNRYLQVELDPIRYLTYTECILAHINIKKQLYKRTTIQYNGKVLYIYGNMDYTPMIHERIISLAIGLMVRQLEEPSELPEAIAGKSIMRAWLDINHKFFFSMDKFIFDGIVSLLESEKIYV